LVTLYEQVSIDQLSEAPAPPKIRVILVIAEPRDVFPARQVAQAEPRFVGD
jgi:hypothetical protein